MKKIIGSLIAVAVIVLLVYVPQYLQKRAITAELQACRSDRQLGEVRDLAGMMLLEVLRQNYGLAANYSRQYFEKVIAVSSTIQNSAQINSLQELLAERDSVTSKLAKADPGSANEVQALFARTYELTRNSAQ
jgi:hypothetical protein